MNEHVAHSPPLTGIVLTTIGTTGWLMATVNKALAAAPAAVVVTGTMTMADASQLVGGLCSLAGVLVYAYVSIRGRLARGENERRLEAGLTDIKLFLARQMAEHQAVTLRRLDAQDKALDAITKESARA